VENVFLTKIKLTFILKGVNLYISIVKCELTALALLNCFYRAPDINN